MRRKLQFKLPSLGVCHGEIVDLITATITGVMGVVSLINSLIFCYYFSAKCKKFLYKYLGWGSMLKNADSTHFN